MNTQPPTQARILRETAEAIIGSLPSRWSGRAVGEPTTAGARADLLIRIESPAGEELRLVLEARRALEPREVEAAASGARSVAAFTGGVPVITSGYLSPRTRDLLADEDIGFADTTGNIRIASDSPGLFILMTGAQRDPWPRTEGLQSLRGRGSSRAVRAIVDFTPPFGIRELAERSGASPASLSRVVGLLEREALVVRDRRGPITDVDWQGVLRRWSGDYDQLRSNTVSRYLAPRGLGDLQQRIPGISLSVATTGAFAAQKFDPVAPARSAALYVTDPIGVADALDLRETDAGANVILLEPYDPVVFDRTLQRDGLTTVAASQLAVDLLTGPGREPSQGEAILQWMKGNEHAWRT